MLAVAPSAEPSYPSSLAALSRNTSVISTSSSDSAPPIIHPRAIRTFNSPRATSRVKSKSPSPSNTQVDAGHFEFVETLGDGSYSTVMRARHIATGKEYAVKILDKNHLIRHNKQSMALAEKNALVKLGSSHPGIIRLYWAFQDEYSLYFVVDLARNGEMQSLISRLGSLSVNCAQYYTAQIVDAVEFMHSLNVIHRDLKPENLLLDDNYRIKIADFGTSKCLQREGEKAKTFVGTSQYVSPELLETGETGKSSDLWALGCIIYQMISGRFAFQGLTDYLTLQKIKKLEYNFPDGFDEIAKDLVQKLLVRDPAQRMGASSPGGANSMQALRAHPFFAKVDWEALWTCPAPTLEPGLFKKDPTPERKDESILWEDIGTVWDEVVASDIERQGPGTGDDGIIWASDAEAPPYMFGRRGKKAIDNVEREGVEPTNDASNHSSPPEARHGDDVNTILGHSNGIAQNGAARFGLSSPIEDSVDKLGQAVEDMAIDRGRNRAVTPLINPGNFQIDQTDLVSLQLRAEDIIFASQVEARPLKRRASLLPSLSIAPTKGKPRLLLLTSDRILCVKRQNKGSRNVTIKMEYLLDSPENAKEKEPRFFLTSIETKGERGFVLITASQSHSYVTEDTHIAAAWVQQINQALSKHHSKPV